MSGTAVELICPLTADHARYALTALEDGCDRRLRISSNGAFGVAHINGVELRSQLFERTGGCNVFLIKSIEVIPARDADYTVGLGGDGDTEFRPRAVKRIPGGQGYTVVLHGGAIFIDKGDQVGGVLLDCELVAAVVGDHDVFAVTAVFDLGRIESTDALTEHNFVIIFVIEDCVAAGHRIDVEGDRFAGFAAVELIGGGFAGELVVAAIERAAARAERDRVVLPVTGDIHRAADAGGDTDVLCGSRKRGCVVVACFFDCQCFGIGRSGSAVSTVNNYVVVFINDLDLSGGVLFIDGEFALIGIGIIGNDDAVFAEVVRERKRSRRCSRQADQVAGIEARIGNLIVADNIGTACLGTRQDESIGTGAAEEFIDTGTAGDCRAAAAAE